MTISVRTQETCPRYYFNVSKVEELWNGFRVYLDNGFYKDFSKDWFDMKVENFSVIPYGYGNNIENGIKKWLVDIYVKAEVKNEK